MHLNHKMTGKTSKFDRRFVHHNFRHFIKMRSTLILPKFVQISSFRLSHRKTSSSASTVTFIPQRFFIFGRFCKDFYQNFELNDISTTSIFAIIMTFNCPLDTSATYGLRYDPILLGSMQNGYRIALRSCS